MTREIKFRVWDKKKKHFIIPWTGDGYDDIDITYTGKNWYITGGHLLSKDRYIMVQYTGLKDEKGKEIYEGDITTYGIVKFGYYDNGYDYEDADNGYGWYLENDEGGICNLTGITRTYMEKPLPDGKLDLKVIGNIYENDLDIISMAKNHSKTMEGLAEK